MHLRRALAALLAAAGLLATFAPDALAASSSPLPGARLLVPEDNPAHEWAQRLRHSHPADAALLDRIGNQPVAMWISEEHAYAATHREAVAGRRTGRVPVVVAYAIPHRDCHGAGAPDAAAYRRYIAEMAKG